MSFFAQDHITRHCTEATECSPHSHAYMIKIRSNITLPSKNNFLKRYVALPILVVARSKAVCGRLVAGIAGSNPARGMDVCLLCLYVVLSCVGRGLRDGPIIRPEESYRVSNSV
jgi:hypothetical protein